MNKRIARIKKKDLGFVKRSLKDIKYAFTQVYVLFVKEVILFI